MQVLLILLMLYCSWGAWQERCAITAGCLHQSIGGGAAERGTFGILKLGLSLDSRRENTSVSYQALNYIYKDLVSIIITQSIDKAWKEGSGKEKKDRVILTWWMSQGQEGRFQGYRGWWKLKQIFGALQGIKQRGSEGHFCELKWVATRRISVLF